MRSCTPNVPPELFFIETCSLWPQPCAAQQPQGPQSDAAASRCAEACSSTSDRLNEKVTVPSGSEWALSSRTVSPRAAPKPAIRLSSTSFPIPRTTDRNSRRALSSRELLEAKRPGASRAAVISHASHTLILPNGYTVTAGRPASGGFRRQGDMDSEGKVTRRRQQSEKAGTVISTTAAERIGALATRLQGCWIGAESARRPG